MKKNTKPTDRKRTFATCGLSALCITVLAGTYFLTRKPETEFIPVSVEQADVTDTWEENSGINANATLPVVIVGKDSQGQLQGTTSDDIQTVVSESETNSTISLSDSSTKEDALQEKPAEPPVTTDDVTDPDKQPEYDLPIRQTPTPTSTPTSTPKQDNPTGSTKAETPSGNTAPSSSHPGQVYDPVFGWVKVGNTQQDNIDSDGDINKQIGTMGGN
jgi:hypothetical protein